ncbi:MAG: ribonuclease P protein component 1 [Candidatus Nanohaloarchaea archaeon]
MPITPENLTRHELIGLQVEVLKCSDPGIEGLAGEVLDETRDTLDIAGKTVEKSNCVFLFKLSETEVEVDGEEIQGRPEDRIK